MLKPETWKVDVIFFTLILCLCTNYFFSIMCGILPFLSHVLLLIHSFHSLQDLGQSLAIPMRLLSWVQATVVVLFPVVTRHLHRSTIAKQSSSHWLSSSIIKLLMSTWHVKGCAVCCDGGQRGLCRGVVFKQGLEGCVLIKEVERKGK